MVLKSLAKYPPILRSKVRCCFWIQITFWNFGWMQGEKVEKHIFNLLKIWWLALSSLHQLYTSPAHGMHIIWMFTLKYFPFTFTFTYQWSILSMNQQLAFQQTPLLYMNFITIAKLFRFCHILKELNLFIFGSRTKNFQQIPFEIEKGLWNVWC